MIARTPRRLPLLVLTLLIAVHPAAARDDRARGAGAFDYYVLTLSWSPQHCASPAGRGDRPQCDHGRHYAFVLHGLWPQYERGFPESCAGKQKQRLSPKLVEGMLDVMPSPSLIRHEWEEHGTCTGLAPDAYFAKARAAFASIDTPPEYRAPERAMRVTPRQIEQDFIAANPQLEPDGIAVLCDHATLREVRICLDRSLRPRACGADVRSRCPSKRVIVPPVR